MDIHELEVLIIVAEEKSFSRAAKILNRTQPAVSQAISRLERELDEKLFDRSSKDGKLTVVGEVVLDYARQMLNTQKAARTAIRDLRELHHGKLKISANEHTVYYLLPLIKKFNESHPLVKIDVSRGVASRIPREVTAREVELGVISFRPKDKTVKIVAVGIVELILIVPPDHHLAKSKTVSVKNLGNEKFIAHNAPSPYREQVIKKFEKHKTDLNISVEMPSLEAIKRLVEMGSGVALVPKLTAQSEISSGQLVGLSVNEMRFERKLYIVYRRNGVLSHAAEEFLQLAAEIGG